MQLSFSIGSSEAIFSRNFFTGTATLLADGKEIPLASPWNPATHLTVQLSKTWKLNVLGHEVAIEKTRPLLFSGLRPQTYRVHVDGELVAEKTGY